MPLFSHMQKVDFLMMRLMFLFSSKVSNEIEIIFVIHGHGKTLTEQLSSSDRAAGLSHCSIMTLKFTLIRSMSMTNRDVPSEQGYIMKKGKLCSSYNLVET